MVWDGACKTFRILGNAEQYSELSVTLAAIPSASINAGMDHQLTVISVKTAYTVYSN